MRDPADFNRRSNSKANIRFANLLRPYCPHLSYRRPSPCMLSNLRRPMVWAMLETVTIRGSLAFFQVGRRWAVKAKWPKWLVPTWSSNPSAVVLLGGIMTPALLMRTSRCGVLAMNSSAACFTAFRLARSRSRVRTMVSGCQADSFQCVRGLGLVAARKNNLGTHTGEFHRHLEPDARVCSSDENNLSVLGLGVGKAPFAANFLPHAPTQSRPV